jgi:hypothetical protein
MSLPVIATNFSGPTGAWGLAAPRLGPRRGQIENTLHREIHAIYSIENTFYREIHAARTDFSTCSVFPDICWLIYYHEFFLFYSKIAVHTHTHTHSARR